MMGAIPNAGPHIEFSIEPTPWTEGIYSPPLTVREGCVEIPGGLGWGVTVNPAWLAAAEHCASQLD
jgi:L-alanine-DL-glutamate epimerase-like enolase superfamily enzyme